MVRSGIALIELIIAIVVMAIVFMAVPSIMEMSTKSSSLAIQQEAISLASSQMDTIASLHWDEKNLQSKGYAKILDVAKNNQAPDAFGYGRYPDINSTYRIGAKMMNADKGQYRRKFEDSVTNASTVLGPDTGESSYADYDDIDDYNGFGYAISEQNATGYKFPYDLNVSVSYVKNDITAGGSPGGSSNIKLVTVRVHETTNDTDIRLKAFFCNIGETKILIKPIP